MTAIKKTTTARPRPKAAPRTPPARDMAKRRADYGAPVDSFFARQTTPLREVLDALRAIVEQAVPDATAALKWGMPVYTVAGRNFVSLGGHKAHVNLVLWGEPGTFVDPDGRLTGDGPSGRILRLADVSDLPKAAVRRWVQAAAERARTKAAKSRT